MQKRIKDMQLDDKRLLDIHEGSQYVNMGMHTFRQWCESIGAVRRFGRSVRFDRRVIDNALDEMGAKTE